MKTYKVKSKSSDKYYTVTEHDDGRFTCQCKYFEFKGHKDPVGECSHIKQVINDKTKKTPTSGS